LGAKSDAGGVANVTVPDTEPRRIVIPWGELVSVNQRSAAKSWTSQAWRDGLAAMRETVQHHVFTHRWGLLECEVERTIDFYPPDRRRRDCGNYEKAIDDAMSELVYRDDSQIVVWSARKLEVSKDARAVVTVTALIPQEAA
jgi:Holliday junction resolvase RusA-like endonuclease